MRSSARSPAPPPNPTTPHTHEHTANEHPRTVLLEAHPDVLLDHEPAHVLAAEDVERAEHQARVRRHAAEELGEVVAGGVVEGAREREGRGDGGEEGEVAHGEDAVVVWWCGVWGGIRIGGMGGWMDGHTQQAHSTYVSGA